MYRYLVTILFCTIILTGCREEQKHENQSTQTQQDIPSIEILPKPVLPTFRMTLDEDTWMLLYHRITLTSDKTCTITSIRRNKKEIISKVVIGQYGPHATNFIKANLPISLEYGESMWFYDGDAAGLLEISIETDRGKVIIKSDREYINKINKRQEEIKEIWRKSGPSAVSRSHY